VSLLTIFAVSGSALLILVLLYAVPRWQVKHLDKHSRWSAENEARRTLATIVGGIAVFTGLAFSWMQIRETEIQGLRASESDRDKLRLEQFDRAANKLRDHENAGLRAAGLYEMGLLAHTSADYHWPAMRVVSEFVREHRPMGQPAPSSYRDHFDIDTALDILASRDIECEAGVAEKLDLSHADLSALIYLPRANFRGFDLFASSLDDAYLAGSDLSNADLGNPQRLASLRNADLSCANLRNVTFVDSDEQVAALQDVHVWLANVRDVTPDRIKRLLLSLGAREFATDEEWAAKISECFVPPAKKVFAGPQRCAS